MKSLEHQFEILQALGNDVSEGHLRNLWKFLKVMRENEIRLAQNYAAEGDTQRASLAVLASGLYDRILELGSPEGILVSEMERVRREMKERLERDDTQGNAPDGEEDSL